MEDLSRMTRKEGEVQETVESAYQDVLFKKEGGCGKFQYIMFATVICGLCGFGYIEYMTGYLELLPQFNCKIDGVWTDNCSTDQICQGQTTNQTEYYIYYNNHTSLYNWVKPLDLVCTPPVKLGLLGSMYFAGWALTILIIPYLADKYGRKWFFTVSAMVTAAVMVVLYVSRSLGLSISMMFVAGMANSGRLMVGFVYANEFLVPKWQIIFGTAFHCIDNSTSVISTAYFDFIDKHYLYLSVFGFAATCFCCVMMVVYMPESPLWHLKMGRITEAQATITRMMKVNGVDAEKEIRQLEDRVMHINRDHGIRSSNVIQVASQDLSSDGGEMPRAPSERPPTGVSARPSELEGRRSILVATEDEQRSTMFYLRQPVVRTNLMVMAYMWACCSFSYYMVIFYLKYLPGNIYNNSFASSGTDCIAVLFGGLFYSKLGIKKTFSLLFSCSVIGGLLIIFIGQNNESLMPIFVVITKFGISGGFVNVYISTVDVFPTLFCGTALGFCNFFARVLTIVAPQVAEREPPLPMIVLCSLCFGGIILIQFVTPLKEQLINMKED